MTKAGTIFCTGRTFTDWRSIGDFATLILAFALLVLLFETHNFLKLRGQNTGIDSTINGWK